MECLEGLEGLTHPTSHSLKFYFESLDGLEGLECMKGLTPLYSFDTPFELKVFERFDGSQNQTFNI